MPDQAILKHKRGLPLPGQKKAGNLLVLVNQEILEFKYKAVIRDGLHSLWWVLWCIKISGQLFLLHKKLELKFIFVSYIILKIRLQELQNLILEDMSALQLMECKLSISMLT